MVYAVMPAFLLSIGAQPAFIGFLEGFADALSSVLKIFSGWLSDRIGKRKKPAVLGYALSVSTRYFLALATSVWQIFGLRIIDRVGKGFRDSPRDALLAESVEKGELGKSFGYQRGMDSIGGFLGPVAAVVLMTWIFTDYRSVFWTAAAVGLISLLCFFFVRESERGKNMSEKEKKIPFTFSLSAFSPDFKKFIASVFVFGLGFMPVSLLLLKTQSAGFGFRFIPIMYVVYSIAFAVFAIPFGRLSDKIGARRVIIFGFLFAIGAYLFLSFASSLTSLVIGFAAIGFYSAMTDGVQRALASKFLTEAQRATGFGFLQAAVGVSSLLAGTVGGVIWTYAGTNQALWYGAALMFIGWTLFVFLVKKEELV